MVPGCRVPLVMRPDAVVSDDGVLNPIPEQTCTLVGSCYIEGFMFKDGMKLEQSTTVDLILR